MTSENTFHTNLIQSYVALTKPKIILMLLFTALGGLFLASSGVPDMTTTLVVLAGGTLASVLYGLSQGVQLFRVHNVKEINQGILVFNKILNTS